MRQVISTEHLPDRERFSFWQDVVAQVAMPVNVRSAYAANYVAYIESTRIGTLDVMRMRHRPGDLDRTRPMIERADPATYNFFVFRSGRQQFTQEGRTAHLKPGSMMLYHASRVFRTNSHPDVEFESAINVAVPRQALPLPDRKLSAALAIGLSSHSGLGALVGQYLRRLATDAATYEATDAARLASITVDLLSVLLARQTDAEPALPVETRESALLTRIHGFIQSHLPDQGLTAETIAAAHHISVRTLHRLFQTNGPDHSGVASWIRQLRLEQCRRDLLDPQLRTRPIHAIAGRWGFTSPAHFSRLFRAVYGVTPRAYQQQWNRTRRDVSPTSRD